MIGHRRLDEGGSTLIIALLLATIFSLLVTSVISFTEVGFRATKSFEAKTQSGYAADGAIQAAMARYGAGNPCTDTGGPKDAGKNAINSEPMTVYCDTFLRASGRQAPTQPSSALLALGSASSEGVQSSSPGLQVQGDVFSNTTIDGNMTVAGDISAVGTCGMNVKTLALAPPVKPYVQNCAPGMPGDAALTTDPQYTAATTTVPVLQTVPACPASPGTTGHWLLTLAPGYYDDGAALNALTAGSCHGVVAWFQPGTYYFDLTFTGGAGVWTVNDSTVNVVGGTPTQDLSSLGSGARPSLTVPGSCNGQATGGVQFVMGGGSRISVTAGHMEVCASATTSGQQIAVYGEQRPPTNDSYTLRPGAVSSNNGFADPGHALLTGEAATAPGCTPVPPPMTTGCTADAALGSATQTTASITLTGFSQSVPPGSVITSADLLVGHEDDGSLTAAGGGSVTVTVPFTGNTCGTNQNGTQPLGFHAGAIVQDTIHLFGPAPGCGLTSPSQLDGLSVTVAATMDTGGTSATERLDGVTLDVVYRTPTTVKPTAVTANTGFTNPGNALEIGEQPSPLTADAALTATTTTASITLAGYGPPIPTGAHIGSVVLRVAHEETGNLAAPTITVPGCAAAGLTIQNGAVGDDRFDATGCVTNPTDLQLFTATYTATVTNGSSVGGTDSLDGMWLEVVYDPPAPAMAQSTTVTATANFANPSNAEAIDGASTAIASLDTTTTSASLTLSGFADGSIPAGSKLDAVTLRVAHGDDAGVGAVTATLSGSAGITASCTTGVTGLSLHTTVSTDSIDLLHQCGVTDLTQLAGLAVTYQASLASGPTNASDTLDGIDVAVVWRPPAVYYPGTAASTGSASTASFSPTSAATGKADGSSAAAMLTTTLSSASIDLSGFSTIPLPAGSVIDKASLSVVHQDADTTTPAPTTPVPPVATVSFGGIGSACDSTHPKTLSAYPMALTPDSVDLTACGFTHLSDLANLTVTYTATLGTGGGTATDDLDGVELEIVYRTPAIEPLAGCLVATPYSPSTPTTTCAVVRVIGTNPSGSQTSGSGFLAVNGTVYTPSAAINLAMTGVDGDILTRGVIARTIWLDLVAKPGFTRPVLEVPPEPVLFTAYPANTVTPTSVDPGTTFTTAPSGNDPLASHATATLGSGNSRATLTLDGFISPSTVLPTLNLDHVVLRITHQDDGDLSPGDVNVTVGGIPCLDAMGQQKVIPLPIEPGGAVTDQIDLKQMCGLSTLAHPAADALSITYTVALSNGETSAMDTVTSMSIDLLAQPLIKAAVAFTGSRATIQSWNVMP